MIGKATRALASPKDPRLLVRDHVDDLAPLLAAADVAVNPVAYGSGADTTFIVAVQALRVVAMVLLAPLAVRWLLRARARAHA